jgi:CheY-specific phosphatase CheX
VSHAPDPGVAAFLDTARVVLRDAVGLECTLGPISPRRSRTEGRIAVLVEVHGDLTGLTFFFPEAFATHTAETMAPSVPLEPELVQLAVSELANVLTGRGVYALAEHGIHIELDPPHLTTATASGVTGTLVTDLGSIEIVFHGLGRLA